MKINSSSPEKTRAIAGLFAKELMASRLRGSIIIALSGNLGTGKTTFVQAFARALGIRKSVKSPTFLIMRSYPSNMGMHKKLVHVDAYRLQHERDLVPLHFKTELLNPKNIVLIEWAEKIKKILPQKTIWIYFDHGKKENERSLYIKTKRGSQKP